MFNGVLFLTVTARFFLCSERIRVCWWYTSMK